MAQQTFDQWAAPHEAPLADVPEAFGRHVLALREQLAAASTIAPSDEEAERDRIMAVGRARAGAAALASAPPAPTNSARDAAVARHRAEAERALDAALAEAEQHGADYDAELSSLAGHQPELARDVQARRGQLAAGLARLRAAHQMAVGEARGQRKLNVLPGHGARESWRIS